MPRAVVVHRFGPFELDPASRQLFCGQKHVRLSSPQSAILGALVAQPGRVVPAETLVEAGWGGLAITENSLRKTVSRLRKTLEREAEGSGNYIETISHEGYRLTAPVQQV